MACNLTKSNVTLTLLAGSNLCFNNTTSPTNSQREIPPNAYISFGGVPKVLSFVFYGLVFLFGISGNLMVFYVLGYRKKRRTSCDLFTLSLAFADILSSIFGPAVMLNDLITDNSDWFYGKAMCHVFPGISPASQTASAWSLVFISIDRYRVIQRPLTSKLQKVPLYSCLSFIWITSIGFAITFGLQLTVIDSICQPTVGIVKDPIILVTLWVSWTWFVPGFILSIVHILAAGALRRNTLQHANSTAILYRDKQNSKIIKMFVIIVVLFLLLTMPYAIFYLTATWLITTTSDQDYKLITMMNYMLYIPLSANACVNPFVYAKMHREINTHIRNNILVWYLSLCCCKEPIESRNASGLATTIYDTHL